MSRREEEETIERYAALGIFYAEYLEGVTPESKYGKPMPAEPLPIDDTIGMEPGYGRIRARGD